MEMYEPQPKRKKKGRRKLAEESFGHKRLIGLNFKAEETVQQERD